MALSEGTIDLTDKISILTKRDLERKGNIQRRKDDKSANCAENERLTVFQDTFESKRAEIEASVLKSSELAKAELPDHLNGISKEILVLQKYVAASSLFLRTYDIKRCQEAIQGLGGALRRVEDELLPKKRFGFKSRAPAGPAAARRPVDARAPRAALPKALCGFADRRGETLAMARDEIRKKDVSADRLEDCVVRFQGSPSTLHMSHLKNCTVFTGPVSTSIFAENCTDCTLVVACQQLRLHSSRQVKIYLHVTSRAIMEDCSRIFLAPYNYHYEGLEGDFEESALDPASNHWQSVDDFNWLKVAEKSPNWSMIPDEERVQNWE